MSEIRIEPKADARARRVIGNRLVEFNFERIHAYRHRSTTDNLTLTLRNVRGKITGGLVGTIWSGWFYVNIFWLSEAERGKGMGRKLLLAAEDEARRRGAKNVHLESWSFQAPEFYKKMGYTEFGRLMNHPTPGLDNVYLMKAL